MFKRQDRLNDQLPDTTHIAAAQPSTGEKNARPLGYISRPKHVDTDVGAREGQRAFLACEVLLRAISRIQSARAHAAFLKNLLAHQVVRGTGVFVIQVDHLAHACLHQNLGALVARE